MEQPEYAASSLHENRYNPQSTYNPHLQTRRNARILTSPIVFTVAAVATVIFGAFEFIYHVAAASLKLAGYTVILKPKKGCKAFWKSLKKAGEAFMEILKSPISAWQYTGFFIQNGHFPNKNEFRKDLFGEFQRNLPENSHASMQDVFSETKFQRNSLRQSRPAESQFQTGNFRQEEVPQYIPLNEQVYTQKLQEKFQILQQAFPKEISSQEELQQQINHGRVDFSNTTITNVQFNQLILQSQLVNSLQELDFRGATLNKVDFSGMSFTRVSFEGATLLNVNLGNTSLDYVSFAHAKIHSTNEGFTVISPKFSQEVNFDNADIDGVKLFSTSEVGLDGITSMQNVAIFSLDIGHDQQIKVFIEQKTGKALKTKAYQGNCSEMKDKSVYTNK